MIFCADLDTTGTLVATPAVALGLWVVDSVKAGEVVLRDGGASGVKKARFKTTKGGRSIFIPFRGGGLSFITNVHVTLTDVESVTLEYFL